MLPPSLGVFERIKFWMAKNVTAPAQSLILISEVHVTHLHTPIDGLVAFGSCVVNERLKLNSIAIHRKLDGSGYRLTYPTKKNGLQEITLFHPLDPELSKAVEVAIFTAYERQVLSQKLYEQSRNT